MGYNTRYDSVDLTRPGQKPGCNPLTFVFFTKPRRFDLKKRIDPGNPVTMSKPKTRTLDRARSENYSKI